jgi:hypothetical protein
MFAISLNPINWVTDAAGAVASAGGEAILTSIENWVTGALTAVLEEVSGYMAGAFEQDVSALMGSQLAGWAWYLALAVFTASVLSVGIGAIRGGEAVSEAAREIGVTALILMSWWGVMALWMGLIVSLMEALLTEALLDSLKVGALTITGFLGMLIALVLTLFFLVFYVELLVLSHLLAFGIIVGPIAIGLRPARGLANVSGQMIRNFVSLSLVPVFSLAALRLALGNLTGDQGWGLQQALQAIAGLAVAMLMPAIVARFLPLGGQGGGSPARAMIGAGIGAAATVGMVAAGGFAGAAAGAGGGGSQAASIIGGGSSGGGGVVGATGGAGPSGGGGGTGESGGPGGGMATSMSAHSAPEGGAAGGASAPGVGGAGGGGSSPSGGGGAGSAQPAAATSMGSAATGPSSVPGGLGGDSSPAPASATAPTGRGGGDSALRASMAAQAAAGTVQQGDRE